MPEQNAPKGSPVAPFSLSRERRVVDVDQVDDVAGYARVNGREVAVHHLDGDAYRAIQMLRDHPEAVDSSELYAAVERACPELTHDEVMKLSGPKIGALIAVAEQSIKEVEAQIPNGPGPTETSAETPRSSPSA